MSRLRTCSPPGLVAFDRGAASHRVLECAKFSGIVAPTGTKVALSRGSILWDCLDAEAWSRVIRLLLVEGFLCCLSGRGLGQRPSWHILTTGGVCGVFRGVTARADRGWCASLILEPTVATAIAKGVLCGLAQLRLALRVVLWARVLLQIVWLHLRSQDGTNRQLRKSKKQSK